MTPKVFHPKFGKKSKRPYRERPRAICFLVPQKDYDLLKAAEVREGITFGAIALKALRIYLGTYVEGESDPPPEAG